MCHIDCRDWQRCCRWSNAKSLQTDAKQRHVFFGDSSVKSFLEDMVHNLVVRPHNEVCSMLGLDDGSVVVIEETKVSGVVDDVVVRGGARVGRIHVCSGIRHCVFALVHEGPGIAHVGGGRVCNGHNLGDALIFEMVDGVDIRSSNDGGKSAKVGGQVARFEFLDCGHDVVVVHANDGIMTGEQCT